MGQPVGDRSERHHDSERCTYAKAGDRNLVGEPGSHVEHHQQPADQQTDAPEDRAKDDGPGQIRQQPGGISRDVREQSPRQPEDEAGEGKPLSEVLGDAKSRSDQSTCATRYTRNCLRW